MSDNRFAYIRKHLGISQRDASFIFNTRLDTIKKWDTGKLWTPEAVLDDLYDLVRQTNRVIEDFATEMEARDKTDPISELYLEILDPDQLERLDMPRSSGWLDHVLGAIIGRLATIHVYATTQLPENCEVDLQWHEFWTVFEPTADVGFVAISDEDRFKSDLRRVVQQRAFQVWFDPKDSYYYIGIPTTAINNRQKTVWVKACHGGKYADHFRSTAADELRYHSTDQDDTPYIWKGTEGRETVGFQIRGDDEEISDSYSLAALIFDHLAETFKTESALREMCRDKSAQDYSVDDPVSGDFINWGEKEKTFMSRNFMVSLFRETQAQADRTLFPEALIEVCSIVRRSEPASDRIDHQVIVIDMDEIELTILLDLRDVMDADKAGKDYAEEVDSAMKIIKAGMSGNEISSIPAYSQISVEERLSPDNEEDVP
jgi:hypothetical protein